jgi:hypothetical protein
VEPGAHFLILHYPNAPAARTDSLPPTHSSTPCAALVTKWHSCGVDSAKITVEKRPKHARFDPSHPKTSHWACFLTTRVVAEPAGATAAGAQRTPTPTITQQAALPRTAAAAARTASLASVARGCRLARAAQAAAPDAGEVLPLPAFRFRRLKIQDRAEG